MNATEILADNLRRLKASDRLTDYRDTGWLEIALEGRGGSLNVFAIEHLASMLGVEPWQLLAPLLGRGRWVERDGGGGMLALFEVGEVFGITYKVEDEWVASSMTDCSRHPSEAAARAAVEAALFEGVAK